MSFSDERDDEFEEDDDEVGLVLSSQATVVLFIVLTGIVLPLSIGLWRWAILS